MKNLWLEGRVEFSAIEQAMGDDEDQMLDSPPGQWQFLVHQLND
ncbi:hypothetical protein HMPREF0290_2360 [Corynebacterium efficiens YS-314]|nr:hypothetical protein [Corynebacterium efficiens]EEW48989.1 hypothetical protein HMPREF0290_2360 [Corynebacterium efficiens YS-314]